MKCCRPLRIFPGHVLNEFQNEFRGPLAGQDVRESVRVRSVNANDFKMAVKHCYSAILEALFAIKIVYAHKILSSFPGLRPERPSR